MKLIDGLLEKTQRKRLLLVFPHPDDETVWASGLVLRARKRGWRVKALCLTRGERGQVHVRANGRSLSQIRQEEMAKAMSILGVEYTLGDFGDGRLRKTKQWRTWLRTQVTGYRPGVVVTYDHSGISGHPDHIAVSLEMLRVVKELDGIKLWWITLGGRARKLMKRRAELLEYLNPPEYELRLDTGEWWRKMRALRSYRSQPLGRIKRLFLLYRKEHFAVADLRKKYRHRYVAFMI